MCPATVASRITRQRAISQCTAIRSATPAGDPAAAHSGRIATQYAALQHALICTATVESRISRQHNVGNNHSVRGLTPQSAAA